MSSVQSCDRGGPGEPGALVQKRGQPGTIPPTSWCPPCRGTRQSPCSEPRKRLLASAALLTARHPPFLISFFWKTLKMSPFPHFSNRRNLKVGENRKPAHLCFYTNAQFPPLCGKVFKKLKSLKKKKNHVFAMEIVKKVDFPPILSVVFFFFFTPSP